MVTCLLIYRITCRDFLNTHAQEPQTRKAKCFYTYDSTPSIFSPSHALRNHPPVWHMGTQIAAQTDVGGKKEMREREACAGGGIIKKEQLRATDAMKYKSVSVRLQMSASHCTLDPDIDNT
ncbi:hypothetical protein TNIN_273821 [Trichonephila inaurata madagascariensis]|uniref:Uncharacterized protein n=1 Tax=Trichonephila inaurata madagascariensis TaxID=2747483 RepID=A0A8X7CSV9_9ARAC|nr:hypothetical protein TNIN_273821 [Trichonephila inaurata madagascariensis]